MIGIVAYLAGPAKKKPGPAAEFTEAQVEDAIRTARGMVSVAARKLGCSRQTVYEYFRRFAALAVLADQVAKEHRQELVDVAEVKLWEKVKAGDFRAVRYALSTQGKSRGFTMRHEQTGPDGGPIPLSGEIKHEHAVGDSLAAYLTPIRTFLEASFGQLAGPLSENGAGKPVDSPPPAREAGPVPAA